MVVFLDLEKAFDRVSHEFLNKAIKAANVGHTMERWLNMLYDEHAPKYRRTQVNGAYSEYFPIRSGSSKSYSSRSKTLHHPRSST